MSFIPNPGFIAAIGAGAELTAALRAIAEHKAEVARAIAPVDTGAYRASIHVESRPGEADVVAGGGEVDYALYIEYGTGGGSPTPTFAVLRRALEGG